MEIGQGLTPRHTMEILEEPTEHELLLQKFVDKSTRSNENIKAVIKQFYKLPIQPNDMLDMITKATEYVYRQMAKDEDIMKLVKR